MYVDVCFWAQKKKTQALFKSMIGFIWSNIKRQCYVTFFLFWQQRNLCISPTSVFLNVLCLPHEPVHCWWLWRRTGAYQHVAHKHPAAKLSTFNFQLESLMWTRIMWRLQSERTLKSSSSVLKILFLPLFA